MAFYGGAAAYPGLPQGSMQIPTGYGMGSGLPMGGGLGISGAYDLTSIQGGYQQAPAVAFQQPAAFQQGAPSVASFQPYQTSAVTSFQAAAPAALYTPGTVQQGNVYAPMFSPATTVQQSNPFTGSLVSTSSNSTETKSSPSQSKLEKELKEKLEALKATHSKLQAEKDKHSKGPKELKADLEELERKYALKKADLKKLEDQYIKHEKANLDALIASSLGSSIEKDRRYIGGLQEAIQRKRNNLEALEATKSNYEAQAMQDKIAIITLSS